MTAVESHGVAMPEWLARHDRDNGAWTVQPGAAVRGDAWTNAHERIMRVPVGGDETNRVIRAHEMMHAKVSPMLANVGEVEEMIPVEVLRAAEEMRVNLLVKTAGFDTDLLVDGSETGWGRRCAEMKDYGALGTAVVAMAGTKAAQSFLRGVRSVDPDLAKAIREIEKQALRFWTKPARRRGDKRVAAEFGSTIPVEYENTEIPRGYREFTLPVARFLRNAIDSLRPIEDVDDGEEETGTGMAPVDRVKRAGKTGHGRFAPLSLDPNVVLDRTLSGRMGRKRIATNTGRNPRRMNRMLTDPQRRVFDRTIRGKGGIVVIDQSGSMHLTDESINLLMESAPGCTIIGYSHSPYADHNAWVIAKDGRRASDIPSGHGGNGVDGPVIRHAISIARRNESIVWVCDGVVTAGSDDMMYDNLTEECARLVRRHGVHMVPTVEAGVLALQSARNGKRLPARYVGPVRTAAEGLGF